MNPIRCFINHLLTACALVVFTFAATGADDGPFGKDNAQIPETANRIDFKVDVSAKEAKPGDIITVTITGTPHKGFHTYPLTQKTPDQQEGQLCTLHYLDTPVSKLDTPVFQPLYPITESEPQQQTIPELQQVVLEHDHEFTWKQDFLVQKTPPGRKRLTFAVHVQVCDQSCAFGTHILETPAIFIDDGPDEPVPADIKERFTQPPILEVIPGFGPAPIVGPPAPKEGPKIGSTHGKSAPTTTTAPAADTDLLSFLGLAVLWGALSLVTPCVFPMIPITVSFFIKQSESKKSSPFVLALVYSGTITTVLTVGGIFLIQILQPFSQHYVTNFLLGVLFLVFALSLFGMFEIVLPSWLVNLTSAREGRGGIVGTMFMALTFSIISFTCVAPFYGGFIGLASSSQGTAWWSNPDILLKLCLGALAYSLTFASPFFFLALFPSLMRTLPKSGAWMNTVKVVMGFLELAAAVKLLRTAELGLMGKAEYLTYDLCLGIYVALAILCGLYLLNLFRLPHDHGMPESLSVGRLMFSIAFISLGLYLMPGLFKQGDGERQRPKGVVFEWLESFLLPDQSGGEIATTDGAGPRSPEKRLTWFGNLDKALKQAETEKKLVFIDFTGLY